MDMNMCGLGVSLDEKIYYPRIVLSYNTPGETGCYIFNSWLKGLDSFAQLVLFCA